MTKPDYDILLAAAIKVKQAYRRLDDVADRSFGLRVEADELFTEAIRELCQLLAE